MSGTFFTRVASVLPSQLFGPATRGEPLVASRRLAPTPLGDENLRIIPAREAYRIEGTLYQ